MVSKPSYTCISVRLMLIVLPILAPFAKRRCMCWKNDIRYQIFVYMYINITTYKYTATAGLCASSLQLCE